MELSPEQLDWFTSLLELISNSGLLGTGGAIAAAAIIYLIRRRK